MKCHFVIVLNEQIDQLVANNLTMVAQWSQNLYELFAKILYGPLFSRLFFIKHCNFQYYFWPILGYIWVRSEKSWTRYQVGADSLAEDTPKFIRPTCPIAQQFRILLKKASLGFFGLPYSFVCEYYIFIYL